MNLTSEQTKVLDFVIATQRATGAPPTVREIARHFGYASPNNASQHLRLIEAKGHIKRIHGRARGLEISNPFRVHASDSETSAVRSVPIVGRIAAGQPITAVESREGSLSLDPDLFRGGELMSLRVKGDSMEGAGIFNGDFAVIQLQPDVNNGEVAAVLLEDEATLKRVFKEPNTLILHAENPKYADIRVSSERAVRIIGKLRGVVRAY